MKYDMWISERARAEVFPNGCKVFRKTFEMKDGSQKFTAAFFFPKSLKPVWHYSFKTIAKRREAIAQAVSDYDAHVAAKIAARAKRAEGYNARTPYRSANSPIGKISLTAAEAAKLIRGDLKKAFPETKFTVRCRNYAGGSSVDVSYTDGPPSAIVTPIAEQYGKRGHDGSDDSTYYVSGEVATLTANGIVAPTYGGFVFVNRDLSTAAYSAMGFGSPQESWNAERHDPRVRDMPHWDFRHGYGARTIIANCY
jgi:hypothetical protein